MDLKNIHFGFKCNFYYVLTIFFVWNQYCSSTVPNVVNNVQSSTTTSNSIRVTWDPPTNVPCNITHYLISYKLLRYLHCSAPVLKSQENNVTVDSGSRGYTIQDLSAASAYLVSVRAITTSGLGEVVDVNVSTLESGLHKSCFVVMHINQIFLSW